MGIFKYSLQIIGACILLIGMVFLKFIPFLGWIGILAGVCVMLLPLLWSCNSRKRRNSMKDTATTTSYPIASQSTYVPSLKITIDMPDEEAGPDLYRISDRQALALKEYYVVDVETTGLDKKRDRIVEIAWAKVDAGKIVDSFSTLVNPEIPIAPEASEVNGIYDADVADAPKYSEIREQVQSALLGAVVVGHNIQFDLGFIKGLLGNVEGRILYLDTVQYARKSFPGIKNYKLATLCKELSLCHQCAHRSGEDVQATKELFEKCQTVLQEKDQIEKAEKQRLKKVAAEEREQKYSASPLYNRAFVFTGEFTVPHSEIAALAETVGAVVRSKVSSKTDYLVVGDLSGPSHGIMRQRLAEVDDMIANGGKVQKITEETYRKMILSAKQAL